MDIQKWYPDLLHVYQSIANLCSMDLQLALVSFRSLKANHYNLTTQFYVEIWKDILDNITESSKSNEMKLWWYKYSNLKI